MRRRLRGLIVVIYELTDLIRANRMLATEVGRFILEIVGLYAIVERFIH